MNFLRSLLFTLLLSVLTIPPSIIVIVCIPLPRTWRCAVISAWRRVVMWLIEHLLGIRAEIRGRDNLPAEPSIILSKHQSAWETLALQDLRPATENPVFVMKRELLLIPFFGWGLAAMKTIWIDRSSGREALKRMVEQGRDRLRHGLWIIIFPEGTRMAPGTTGRYKIGGAHLAVQTGAKVVPIAHNAGECWAKNAFVKKPGKIVMSIGPAIDPKGMTDRELNARVEAWIEGEMRRISPQHYPSGDAASASEAPSR